jgi:hypothetical protein
MRRDNRSRVTRALVTEGPAQQLELEKQMNHKLINQLTASNASEDEIVELFVDLQFIYDNPFDEAIEDAITVRRCAYVEIPQAVAN